MLSAESSARGLIKEKHTVKKRLTETALDRLGNHLHTHRKGAQAHRLDEGLFVEALCPQHKLRPHRADLLDQFV
jgi:hypothetical protein